MPACNLLARRCSKTIFLKPSVDLFKTNITPTRLHGSMARTGITDTGEEIRFASSKHGNHVKISRNQHQIIGFSDARCQASLAVFITLNITYYIKLLFLKDYFISAIINY